MSDYLRWFAQVFCLTLGILVAGTCVWLLIRTLRIKAGVPLPPVKPLPTLLTLALVGDVLMTLILTFFERAYTVSALQLIPFAGLAEGEYTLFFLNIGVFVPFGALLFPRLRRILPCTAISCAFSLLIELLQLIFRRGVCDIDDLICNTLGGFLGAALICALTRLPNMTFRR